MRELTKLTMKWLEHPPLQPERCDIAVPNVRGLVVRVQPARLSTPQVRLPPLQQPPHLLARGGRRCLLLMGSHREPLARIPSGVPFSGGSLSVSCQCREGWRREDPGAKACQLMAVRSHISATFARNSSCGAAGPWLHGLKVVAAAVVAQALWGMSRTLCPDRIGGGHVVLPLLQAEVVAGGWVSAADFLAGYGAAPAVPGPLFTFAAYLGAVADGTPHGVAGAAIALAAFYDPVWTNAILSVADFMLAAGAFVLLVFWRVPPWIVVALCALTTGFF